MKVILKVLVIFLILAMQATSRRHKLLRRGKEGIIKKTLIKSYQNKGVIIGQKLGEGGFSTVYEGEDEFSGNKSAVKSMFSTDDKKISAAKKEIGLMTKVKGLPAMLPICGYKIINLPNLPEKSGKVVSLHLPKATGSLHDDLIDKLRKGKQFDTAAKYDMFVQMAIGLDALHNKGFIHRDIKPGNFLKMDDKRIVYADFGFTVNKSRQFKGIAGTRGFVPFDYDSYGKYVFGPSVDVYALGLTMACIDYPELYYTFRKGNSEYEKDGISYFGGELIKPDKNAFRHIESIQKIVAERTKNRNELDQKLFFLIYTKLLVSWEKRINAKQLLESLRSLDQATFNEIDIELHEKDYCLTGQDKTEFGSGTDEGNTQENQIYEFGANPNQLSKINPNHLVEIQLSIEEQDLAETARMLEGAGIHEQFEDFDSADEEAMLEHTSANNHRAELGRTIGK